MRRRDYFDWNLNLTEAGRDREIDQSAAKHERLARHIEGVNYLKKPTQIIETVALSRFRTRNRRLTPSQHGCEFELT
jgi:hypothetical protein